MDQASPRQTFATELADLEHELLEMGSLAEQMIGQAVDSLVRLDPAAAMVVVLRDDEIDQLDLRIESRCLRLLALQAPVGADLRTVGTAMKAITDIERIGDLAVDIAKIGMKIEKELGSSSVIDIPRIASLARSMFRLALEAFVRRDLDLVKKVCADDDEVDDLYREMRAEIFANMRDNPSMVVSDGWLFLALHHLERIADHAVNIAERVNFMVTGELRQLAASHRNPSVVEG